MRPGGVNRPQAPAAAHNSGSAWRASPAPKSNAVIEDRLPAPLLGALAAHGSTRLFRANAILISEGDRGDALFIVLSGQLRTYASSEEGRDVVLSDHGPGEYVGELALDGMARSASVKTLVPSSCCVVSSGQLQAFLGSHPEFALHLSQKLTRMVRRLTEQVKSLALQDVYGRMVRVLVELSDPSGDERVVRQPLTQQDIADRVGASREMVSRVMKELTGGDYVAVRDGRYVIRRNLPAAR